MFNRLHERQQEPELMDQPGLDEKLHRDALAGLRRLHQISGSGQTLWSAIAAAVALDPGRTWRVLDIASGGGDLAIEVARRATRRGLKLVVDGCDKSPFAVRCAAARSAAQNVTNVRFFERDVLAAPLPDGYDVVMCSLFLHHLANDVAVAFLAGMARVARRLVLVNDLCRSTIGCALAWLGCYLLTRSPVVHVDGPRSLRAAFSIAEIQEVVHHAGLTGALLARRWPCWFVLQWRPA